MMSATTIRPGAAARQAAVMSGPASGRPVVNVAARGRSLFSACSAHVLRRSRVATVALNEFRLSAGWSSSAGIKSCGRAHRPVAGLAPGTLFKHSIRLSRSSSQRFSTQRQAQSGTGWACGSRGSSGAAPARPNPSVEPTPNSVAAWPGGGYVVHSPPPGQAATLSGSPHLKR
jgi:hypothetical protein